VPSTPHEVLIATVSEEPALLDTLLQKLKGLRLPRGLKPTDSTARHVKAVDVRLDLLLRAGRRWVIIEVQRGIDPVKRRRWLLAASLLLDQTGTLGDVIVITARRAVARWAERVAHLRARLGTVLQLKPVVLHLGAAEAKALLDERHPELALFAAWTMQHRHGRSARALVNRAFEVTERLPRPLQLAQGRAILSVLSKRMRERLNEAAMNPEKYPVTPAVSRFIRSLERRGQKRGLAEGEARGEARGEVRGRAEGRQDSLLTILRTRGLPVSTAEEARIRACTATAEIDRWIERAVTASSVREVIGAKPAAPSNKTPRSPSPQPRSTRPRARP